MGREVDQCNERDLRQIQVLTHPQCVNVQMCKIESIYSFSYIKL